MNKSVLRITFGVALLLFLPLALVHTYRRIRNLEVQMHLDLLWLRKDSERSAYCRDLQVRLPDAPIGGTMCGYYLRHDPKNEMSDMLLESRPHCRPGWQLHRGRCRKFA